MSLFKNYFYSLSYQLLNILVPVLTIPYISNVLGADLVGLNAFLNSIVMYFVLLATLGLNVYAIREVSFYRDSFAIKKKVFYEILYLKMFLGIISVICFFIFSYLYNDYFYFMCFQSLFVFNAIFDTSWYFSAIENFKFLFRRNLLVKILSVFLVFSLVKSRDDLDVYMMILSFPSLLLNILFTLTTIRKLGFVDFSEISLFKHFIPSLGLFYSQLLTLLFISFNKLSLANLSDLSQVGFFENSDKIVRILLTFLLAIGTVVFPRIANLYKNNKNDDLLFLLNFSIGVTSLLSIPIVLGLFIISENFSLLFFGSGFLGIDKVLTILAITLIFMGWTSNLGSQFFVLTSNERMMNISILIGILFLILSSILLIPELGAIGAALSSLIGEISIFICQIVFIRKFFSLKDIFYDLPKILIASVIMAFSCWLVGLIAMEPVIKLVVQLVFGAFIYFIMIVLLKPKLILNFRLFKGSFNTPE